MRRLVCALLLMGTAAPAAAGDDSWLRGSTSDFPAPQPFVHWSGFYGGAQLGADFHGADLRRAAQPFISNFQGEDGFLQQLPLPTMSVLPVVNTKGPSYGGFAGYNYRIDDAVLGFEVNLSRSSMSAAGSDNELRSYIINDANSHTWSVTTSLLTGGVVSLEDYGSLRGRFGWAFGDFLPYLFLGLSFAQVDTYRYGYVGYLAVDITPQTESGSPPVLTPTRFGNRGQSLSDIDYSHGKYTFGFSVGAGIDYALTQNIFLRGEIEYLQLSSVNNIELDTTSVRAGAGLKF